MAAAKLAEEKKRLAEEKKQLEEDKKKREEEKKKKEEEKKKEAEKAAANKKEPEKPKGDAPVFVGTLEDLVWDKINKIKKHY